MQSPRHGRGRLHAARTVDLLLAAGHTVTGLDNLNDAYDVRLKELAPAAPAGPAGFDFHKLDITRLPALADLFASQPAFDGRHQPGRARRGAAKR